MMKDHGYKALVLRTCKADMTSRNGFIWPREGEVVCPDWQPTSECGNGLHGALWGEGDGSLFNWEPDAVWQVIGVDEWVDLGGKVKFPRGVVLHSGDQDSATRFIIDGGAKEAVTGHGYGGLPGKAMAGDEGTAAAGSGIVGKNGIKPDTWYRCKDGMLIKVRK